MKTSSLNKLIRKCRKQDRKAQMELYKLYCDAMFHVSVRIVHQTETAQEIMQDSFMTAFEKMNTFDPEKGVFGAWLKRIVINNSINHLRKEKDIYFQQLSIYEDVEEEVENPEFIVNEEDYSRFKDSFKELKENYKVILTLHYMEGYDLEEIGGILNISYANTRTMLTRAKQALKKKVELV